MSSPIEPTEPTEPTAATEAISNDSSNAELDFERAEFDEHSATSRVCNVCGRPIVDRYFAHGATTICPQCQPDYASKLGASSPAAALGYGLLAASVGALIWYAIRAFTGYELGIIAIVVGIAVGAAVRKGAGPSNAVVYRVLAVTLAYMAIVSTYIPEIAAGMMQSEAPDPTLSVATTSAPSAAASVAAYVFAAGLSLILPYFMLTGGEVMGVLILAIGLWEAWRRSAPNTDDRVDGPFQINAAS